MMPSMTALSTRAGSPRFALNSLSVQDDTEFLHAQCAVYTDRSFAAKLLDECGWTADGDICDGRFLEPAAGDGAILTLAVERLCDAAEGRGERIDRLVDAIRAYEIQTDAWRAAKSSVVHVLTSRGVSRSIATSLANAWIRRADFLIQTPDPLYSHAAANPPYVRWRAVPDTFRRRYERLGFKGVDLSLAFLARTVEWLAPGGKAAFLCNDRWPYAVHGASVRETMLISAELLSYRRIDAAERPFSRKVGAYGSLSVLRKRAPSETPDPAGKRATHALRTGAAGQLAKLRSRFVTFEEAGCAVRVGPAFGHACFKRPNDGHPLALEVPLVSGADITETGRAIPSSLALFPIDAAGEPLRPGRGSELSKRLGPHRSALEGRACVTRGAREWFEPIDRLRWQDVHDEKLLVAGIARSARIAHDEGGLLPSNGVYMIRSSVWPLKALARILRGGLLDLVCDVVSPTLGGGTRRYQASVIRETPLPAWPDIDEADRRTLAAGCPDPAELRDTIRRVLGMDTAWYRGPAA